MAGRLSLLPVFVTCFLVFCEGQSVEETISSIEASFQQLKETLKFKDKIVAGLTRQLMLNQFQDEERNRAEGQSGIVQVRNYILGSENYNSSSFSSEGFASIHENANYPNMIGMGEFEAMLNGVQFRTRHSDYLVQRASTTSKEWHAMEPIPPPPVPQSVLDLPTVELQIAEMQEYFRAFKEQDKSIRDYTPYFKPILCYLEGAWLANYTDIDDGFPNIRHSYADISWEDQMEKARLQSYLGTQLNRYQNQAMMPTAITGIDEETNEPIYAQWNYRILCHPIEEEIPTSKLTLKDDISYRFPRGIPFDDLNNRRGAHYTLADPDESGYPGNKLGLLDRIVANIPGKDNIPDMMNQQDFGMEEIKDVEKSERLNQGYYNRRFNDRYDYYSKKEKVRGFSDANLFVALTTQPQVAPLRVTTCYRVNRCSKYEVRASYMFPLEVVYQSPLLSWNPYGLPHVEGDPYKPPANRIYNGDKDGKEEDKAFNETNDAEFYRTPVELFTSAWSPNRDRSDGGYINKWILDSGGIPHKCISSGYKIVLPEIPGVGQVRLRYPIAPVHEQGSAVYKELNAFKNYLADQLMKISQSDGF